MAGVEEEGPLEALPVARRGLVRWWSCALAGAIDEEKVVLEIDRKSVV